MDHGQALRHWLDGFAQALDGGGAVAASEFFEAEGYWRDLLSFTWNIKTCEGRPAIAAMLNATLAGVRPSNWQIDGAVSSDKGVTAAFLSFETRQARGKGHIRLRDGKCWTLLTTMAELKGHEEQAGTRRPQGVEHKAVRNRLALAQRQARQAARLGHDEQPYCLIIGGGHCGLGLGARLKRLGVPALVIDRHQRPGDSWRMRYESLCLHDPVWYGHMPYLPFPDHWPVFSSKDRIADWLEAYAKVMEVNCWTATTCERASYDEARAEWIVEVQRGGVPLTLRPRQLVLATGRTSIPTVPNFPGMARFEGEQHHASAHPGPAAYAGKRCVVIGSNNSAHDIAMALWEAGAEVTMVQRSSTLVVKSATLMELGFGSFYSEQAVRDGLDHNRADLLFASIPYGLMPSLHRPVYADMAKRDAAFYERLKAAGFLLDWGEDESGLFVKYLRRGSGSYIDTGASELIAAGEITLRSGVSVDEIRRRSIRLSDGSDIAADLIVYATGYQPMNAWAARLISQEVADRIGPCWGLGSGTKGDPGPWEGELRNIWKPTRQTNLWFHCGNLHQARHYSQFLALQIKARMEGLPTPVYGLEATS